MHKASPPDPTRRFTPLTAAKLLPHKLRGGWIISGFLPPLMELQRPTPAIQHDEPRRVDNA